MNTTAENVKKEFGFTNKQATKQLKDKCRFYRKEIESAMLWENEITNTSGIIKERRELIKPFAEQLVVMEQSGVLQIPLITLIKSMIHMSMNRWFRTKNRLHELTLYEFLARHYTSETAKIKHNKT